MRGSRNGPSFSCPRPFPARLFIFRSGAPPLPSAHHFACPALSLHPVRCPLSTAHLRSTEKLERCAPYESPSSPTCTCPAHALVSLGAALLALARAGLWTVDQYKARCCCRPRFMCSSSQHETRPLCYHSPLRSSAAPAWARGCFTSAFQVAATRAAARNTGLPRGPGRKHRQRRQKLLPHALSPLSCP